MKMQDWKMKDEIVVLDRWQDSAKSDILNAVFVWLRGPVVFPAPLFRMSFPSSAFSVDPG